MSGATRLRTLAMWRQGPRRSIHDAFVNPIMCEVTRGTRVESVHRGAFAVVDAAGGIVEAAGDVDAGLRPLFAEADAGPALVESGAADAAALSTEALAIAAGSHSSEPGHVATVRTMLDAAGVSENDLGCGAHWPRDVEVAVELGAGGGRPGRIHNNCSGKHASFLLTSRHRGVTIADYLAPDHPLQREVREIIADLSGAPLSGDVCSVDGCSAPTYALPLQNLAGAFARLIGGHDIGTVRADAARCLMSASMAAPWYVAGTNRFCTRVMEAGQGAIYAKTGAEGVYVAAVPKAGLALALKCDDGAPRASEICLASLLSQVLRQTAPELADAVAAMARRPVKDFNGTIVGVRRVPGN